MDCNILISLLPERKPLKIASKLGFLAPGLEKWTKVVQAWILVKNGRVTVLDDNEGDVEVVKLESKLLQPRGLFSRSCNKRCNSSEEDEILS